MVSIYGAPVRTVYPCCERAAVLRVVEAVPIEKYDRTCGRCGTKWEVERRRAGAMRPGVRVDVVTWTTPLVQIHAKNRGSLLAKEEL